MSVDNSELLMLLGAKKSKSALGEAGQQGFGVGVYGGSPADLTAMGLAPMEGCNNPKSENYGNYIHTNGSIMCCIPAFCYRLGNASAPSYSRDGSDALEIRDATEFVQFSHDAVFSSPDFGDGWILHRAFVDGGKLKRAFFIDKYLCSNVNNQAASVKNADWLMCLKGTNRFYTSYIAGTSGVAYDAITLSRARGNYYSLVTCYQWSAISLLSLAHGQAATSSAACAWYDANHTTNFPKGATDQDGRDIDDNTISYTSHSYGSPFGKTGAGTPFNKTTHNGQASGVADVAGMCNQWTVGAVIASDADVRVMDTIAAAHEFTKDNVASQEMYTTYPRAFIDSRRCFNGVRSGTLGLDWAGAGIFPKTTIENVLFGADEYYERRSGIGSLKVGLGYTWGEGSGIFCRSWVDYDGHYDWGSASKYHGFRAAAYPP